MVTGFFDGGECGIRTHVPLRTTAFRVRLVMTTSIRFLILYSIKLPCRAVFRRHLQKYTTNLPAVQAKLIEKIREKNLKFFFKKVLTVYHFYSIVSIR